MSEYSHIADAHFKTIDTISTFFRHYLVIVSIPISAMALFLSGKYEANQLIGSVVSGLLIAIAIAGLGVLVYILNLRLDAMLYARTINGIRKYFYDRAAIDIDDKLRMRVLPQSPHIPSYFEKAYFLPVVLVFAVLNASLACLAWAVWGIRGSQLALLSTLTVALAMGVHVLLYYMYARYRERQYLRSCIIGVDIDGVLNRHREQFCKFLQDNVGKKIDPDAITTIPVRECENLGVTEADEENVFNDPRYWTTMRPAYGAALRAFFSWAERDGFIDEHPMKFVRIPSVPLREMPFFTDEEVIGLLKVVERPTLAGRRNYAMLVILLDTGIRVSELTGLKMGNVHLIEGCFKVLGKGDRERIVPLGRRSRSILNGYIRRFRPEPATPRIDNVFLTVQGYPMNPGHVHKIIAGACDRAGISGKRRGPHTCRHTFARNFLLNGGNLLTLQRILGHSSLEMVRRYVSLDTRDLISQQCRFSPIDLLAEKATL